MREWNLKPGDPISLTLAADARLSPTDYCDDQIWELSLGGGEPPALSLQTTYGLRARILRLFPRFIEGDEIRMDPAGFANPPVIRYIYPNFIALTFSPFPDIDVEAEYWVPQSQSVAGRLRVANHSAWQRQIRLEWVGQLTPTDGQRMAPLEMQAAPILTGYTDQLAPVVFLTGGPQVGAGSYPSLTLSLDLDPGHSRYLTWSHAALSNPDDSFNLARQTAARKWDAERARLELVNAGQIDIYTGDPDWDAAFALTQRLAFSLFVGPSGNLPYPSFVLTRLPDQGYSLRGDGSDYNHLWNGQTPLDAYHLAGLILPSAPSLAQGLVHNFLAVQAGDGSVDWKPGLGGQRSRLLATPILVSLAWRIFEASEDKTFLEQTFPGLLKFVRAWFTPHRDRDGDGIPEWDHLMQAGLDDHPLFSRWQPWSRGIEISTAESPDLCAFLYRECTTLVRIAELLGRTEPLPALQSLADHLRIVLETAWDPEESGYFHWDRDTHFSTRGEWLGQRQGPGEILLQRSFDQPVRLLVRIETNGESTRRPQIFVHGTSTSGNHRVEHLTDNYVKWYLGIGSLTGDRVYAALEKIEIQGLDPEDQVNLYTAGYHCQDQTLLLPLWAQIPDPERARKLVENTITNPEKYWRPYGMPACAWSSDPPEDAVCRSINLPWNSLIGEGLVRYGYLTEAAGLVTRLMAGVILNLKRSSAFRRYYHSETGEGSGEWNALNGLAPLKLFLDTLGVRLISPQRVRLSGFNPFPWPVTVKYRGMTVLRQKEKTMVIFPDGQTAIVDDPSPRLVSLEK